MRKLFSALIVALCAVSCIWTNPIYQDTTMVDVINPTRVITDSGITYNIESQLCDGTLETGKRTLVVCNVTKKRSDTEYDAELLSFVVPLNKAVVRASSITDPLGDDPVGLSTLWESGGYLNMRFVVQEIEEGKTHTMNLEWLDTEPADTLRFVMHHDDGIDGIRLPSDDDMEIMYGVGYATFPIKDLVPAGVKEMPIKITWVWDKQYCVKDGFSIVIE